MLETAFRAALACGVAAALAACGGSSGGGGGLPVGTATAGGGMKAIAAARAARHGACFKISPYMQANGFGADDVTAASFDAAVAAGRVAYSRTAADACVAWLRAASCADLGSEREFAACGSVLAPRVANDQPCLDDVECANGYCALEDTCPGTCRPYRALGAECREHAECPVSAVCWDRCFEPSPTGADGERCSNGFAPCKPGLFCDSDVCRPQHQANAPCTTEFECAAGLVCAGGAGAKRCVAIAGEGEDCAATVCGEGFHCSRATSTCVPFPTEGQSCAGFPYCIDGSSCAGGATPVCTRGTVPLGGTCLPASATASPGSLCVPWSGNSVLFCSIPAGSSTGTCTKDPWAQTQILSCY